MNPEFSGYMPEELQKEIDTTSQANNLEELKEEVLKPDNFEPEDIESDEIESQSIRRIGKEIPELSLKDNLDYESTEETLRKKRATNIKKLVRDIMGEKYPENWEVDGSQEDVELIQKMIINTKYNTSEKKERNAEITLRKYGIIDGESKTFKKIAEDFQLSPELVRKTVIKNKNFLYRSNLREKPLTDCLGHYEETTFEKIDKNPRVISIRKQIKKLENEFASIISDLKERENKPEFTKAQKLFEKGYRVNGWGKILTDTNNETILYNTNDDKYEEIGYWADGVDRNTDSAFELLNISDESNNDEILKYLNDLTLEKKQTN